MKNVLIFIGILIVAAFIGFSWYVGGVNHVVALDESVKSGWAQVENQLQRRNDLIPNLVATVKGFAKQEMGIFTEVTRLRSQWGQAKTIDEKIDNAGAMSGALSRLLLVAENYPALKSDQNFLTLQSQLEGTENRIAVERMRYNEGVQAFNTYIRTFFGSFFAGQKGLTQPAVYFKADEKSKEVPQVSF